MKLNPFKKFSLFQLVITSLVLGIAAGIFFGEPMGKLEIVGDIYIKLLQMTVIPYILVSLIGGIGRLDSRMAKLLGLRGGALILTLWGITVLTTLCLPLAYPDWKSSSFFSAPMTEARKHINILDMYIPANPFYALANTIVPAVVIFSIFLGSALISVKNKDYLILDMQSLSDALMKMASMVANTAPIGIFALSAAAAGTLQVHALMRLQVYLYVYIAAWLIIAFYTLPMLVARATPFTYQEVIKEARLPMITAFATGTVLVVLPMIAEKTKKLLEKNRMDNDASLSAIDALVPTTYSFPSVGTVLGLGFVLFAAWFAGSPLGISHYPEFCIMGIFSAFGSLAVAIPFLLDYFRLPADLFQLYVLGSVFTLRFVTAIAAMHGVVICLLVTSAIVNRLKWTKILEVMAITLGLSLAVMTGLGIILSKTIHYDYAGYKQLINKELIGPLAEVNNNASPAPLSPEDQKRSRIDIIRERGSVRVGYSKDRLPFAFKNEKGQVIGYDMELAHALARDLGVRLDVVRIDWPNMERELDQGRIDLAVGGITISPERALRFQFSRSYLDEFLSLVVLDYRRDQFSSYEKIRSMKGLKLGVTPFRYKEGAAQRLFPNAELVIIKSPRDFFRGEFPEIDAMLYTAQTATGWTLVYPEWTVVIPNGLEYQCPMAFAMPDNQQRWKGYINTWLETRIKTGLTEQAYRHWILGEELNQKEKRWSVIQNVLGWVD